MPEAGLLTKSGFNGNSLAASGATARNYSAAALGLHTGAKAVRLRTMTTVRLECTFRHEKSCAPVMSSAIWVNGKYKRRRMNGKPGRLRARRVRLGQGESGCSGTTTLRPGQTIFQIRILQSHRSASLKTDRLKSLVAQGLQQLGIQHLTEFSEQVLICRRENFYRKDFHKQIFFVLVCRSVTAF